MKKILITGALSAIAKAVARQFAAEGALLVLVARDIKRLEVLRDDLEVRGAGEVTMIEADLDHLENHETILRKSVSAMGQLDIVLAAQGVLGNEDECRTDSGKAEAVFKTNFESIACFFERAVPHLGEKAMLAAISSVAGERGRKKNYYYGASKAALNVFLEGLRARLAKTGVHVLTVKPGFVDTPMTAGFKKGPLFASPEAVARDICRAISRRKNTLYTPWFWRWIMLIIKLIPETIFKRMKI